MSLSVETVEKLRRVRAADELLASGFIRLNSMIDIPYVIIQICIAFMMRLEEWDPENEGQYLLLSGRYNQIC